MAARRAGQKAIDWAAFSRESSSKPETQFNVLKSKAETR